MSCSELQVNYVKRVSNPVLGNDTLLCSESVIDFSAQKVWPFSTGSQLSALHISARITANVLRLIKKSLISSQLLKFVNSKSSWMRGSNLVNALDDRYNVACCSHHILECGSKLHSIKFPMVIARNRTRLMCFPIPRSICAGN